MSVSTIVVILITTVVLLAFVIFKRSFKYWVRRHVPCDQPVFPYGSFKNAFQLKENDGIVVQKMYKMAKVSGFKEYGIYMLWKPIYIPVDPHIIKNILTADFQKFADRGVYYNKKDSPLGAHLFNLDGNEWKPLRTKLTPTFTSGKMKMMFPTVVHEAERLTKTIDHLISLPEPINIREPLGQFLMNVIGSCAFGLDCNTFENPNSDFIKYSQQVFMYSTWKRFKEFFGLCLPNLSRKFRLATIETEITKFYLRIIRETVHYRQSNGVVRNDFMQILLNLTKSESSEGRSFTFEEIAAQAYIFFVAGYDTTSSTMMFCLYELSINPDLQEKVRNDINRVLEKHDGKVTYESIMDMKYLRQTIDETLRKYPSVPYLIRKSRENYIVPDTKTNLEKGTSVFISCLGLHNDPEFYPAPEKFDPERFSEENMHKIAPYTYLPFGEGPRNCIGIRFAIMGIKIGLSNLLIKYKFSLNGKTKTPVKIDPASFMLLPLDGMWFDVEKLKSN